MAEVIVPAGDTAPVEGLAPSEQPIVEGAAPVSDTPTIEIDGQTYTQEEVRLGMLRQSDYTSKTQSLAAERQRVAQAEAVWAAINEDPAGSIEALREHFAEQLAPAAPAEPVDPEDAWKSEVQSYMNEQREAQVTAQVNAELTAVEARHGAFDRVALLQHAIDFQIGNLDAAVLHMRATSGASAKEAADAAALAAKQALPPVSGGSAALGSAPAGGKPITSIKDAFMESLAEAGASSVASL